MNDKINRGGERDHEINHAENLPVFGGNITRKSIFVNEPVQNKEKVQDEIRNCKHGKESVTQGGTNLKLCPVKRNETHSGPATKPECFQENWDVGWDQVRIPDL